MNNKPFHILTINSGSSSIKFSIYALDDTEVLLLRGEIREIGKEKSPFRITMGKNSVLVDIEKDIPTHREGMMEIIRWLEKNGYGDSVCAVGHRIVHGGTRFREHCVITEELIKYLREIKHLAPEHLPHEIDAIDITTGAYPGIQQVACFDTAFHRNMPLVARVYPFSEDFYKEGIIRYGFHGLSYEYVMEELHSHSYIDAGGRIIIAHLGHGASMAAVRGGKGIDTTMGFTPTGGLVMSTRSGDLDPGVLIYLLKEKGMSPEDINRMVNHQSGLLGVSGISDDLKELLLLEGRDKKAAEAIELFCYTVRKFIGAFSAVLGGLDTLIFTAGTGENSPEIRSRICEGLDFLGIRMDPERNRLNSRVISKDNSPVSVQVIKTNEELMIARHTKRFLKKS